MKNRCIATGKTIFNTLEEANIAMYHFKNRYWDHVTLKRRNRRSKKAEQKRAYMCEFCDGFHLTSQAVFKEGYKQ